MKIENSYVPTPGDKNRLDYELHFTKKDNHFFVKWLDDWDHIDPVKSTDYNETRKLAMKAGEIAIKKFMSLGTKILIGIKSSEFEQAENENWRDDSGHVKYDGCSLSFGWCIVEEFNTKSDYERFEIIEKSENVRSFGHRKYQSKWDIFGSDFKVHLLKHSDKNLTFCKEFETSMKAMVNRISEAMKETDYLVELIDQIPAQKLLGNG